MGHRMPLYVRLQTTLFGYRYKDNKIFHVRSLLQSSEYKNHVKELAHPFGKYVSSERTMIRSLTKFDDLLGRCY
jgi:hypothetical protein